MRGRRPRAGPEMGPKVCRHPAAARCHRPGRDGLRVLRARVRDAEPGACTRRLSQRTVSRLLRFLCAEPDPLLDVVSRGRMARADRIALRIPDAYADSVRWRRRRAGRIDGIHPAFLVLGGTAGLVHQVLDGTEARGAEVARAARLSPSATSAALRILAEHGLAERGRGGWRRGDADLDDGGHVDRGG